MNTYTSSAVGHVGYYGLTTDIEPAVLHVDSVRNVWNDNAYENRLQQIERYLIRLEKAYSYVLKWIGELEEELKFRGIDIDENLAKLFEEWNEDEQKESDTNGD